MLKEILESMAVSESKVTVKDLEKLLDKYDYSDDPEEIAFALGDDSLATMSIDDIVKKLNKERVNLKDIEKQLKDALN